MKTDFYFDKVVCICMDDRPAKRDQLIKQLQKYLPGVEYEIFRAISTRHLNNHHIGCGLSHRAVIEDAKKQNCKNVLVFEEDAVLHKDFSNILAENIKELQDINWSLFYLGACVWQQTFKNYKDCKSLQVLRASTCTQGIAYNETVFDYILSSVPDNIEDMTEWCKKHLAIDQWLMYYIQNGDSKRDIDTEFISLISSPRICSQPFLIGPNKQDSRDDFSL